MSDFGKKRIRLADDYAATCFAQSMMLEDGYGASTPCDINTALTVQLLSRLSRERVYYGDLQHVDRDKREIKIVGDGACPPSLAGKLGPVGLPGMTSRPKAALEGCPISLFPGVLLRRPILSPTSNFIVLIGSIMADGEVRITFEASGDLVNVVFHASQMRPNHPKARVHRKHMIPRRENGRLAGMLGRLDMSHCGFDR